MIGTASFDTTRDRLHFCSVCNQWWSGSIMSHLWTHRQPEPSGRRCACGEEIGPWSRQCATCRHESLADDTADMMEACDE